MEYLVKYCAEIHQEYFQQNPNVTGSLSGVTETIAVVATEEEMS